MREFVLRAILVGRSFALSPGVSGQGRKLNDRVHGCETHNRRLRRGAAFGRRFQLNLSLDRRSCEKPHISAHELATFCEFVMLFGKEMFEIEVSNT